MSSNSGWSLSSRVRPFVFGAAARLGEVVERVEVAGAAGFVVAALACLVSGLAAALLAVLRAGFVVPGPAGLAACLPRACAGASAPPAR